MGHHALVFGASGILGWAVVNEILSNYPKKGTYSRVTALTNRPLTREEALWPESTTDVPALEIVPGIDLTSGTAGDTKERLKEEVSDIHTVDHVFYYAYNFHPDFPAETQINLQMLRAGLGALEALAPNISYVIFPTGTKGYGVHLTNRLYKAPFVETMVTLPEPSRSELFYYALRDELSRAQKGKRWQWAEIRVDMVIGFTPHTNPFNLVARYAAYLSLHAYMHSQHHPAAVASVPYPNPGYNVRNNEGNQDLTARLAIHLCLLDPTISGNGELYNSGGEVNPASYAERWDDIRALFGLRGSPPSKDNEDGAAGFLTRHADVLEALWKDEGVDLRSEGRAGEQGAFPAWTLNVFTEDNHYSLEKARGVGFLEEEPSRILWNRVLGRYKRAGRVYIKE